MILNALECRQDTELSLLFTDDRYIAELNRKYLKKDGPTDVISFPMNEGDENEPNSYLLGDIVISIETAVRQADREGHSLGKELYNLIIHGVLHLLGYDHERNRNAHTEMFKKQEELLNLLISETRQIEDWR